MTRTKAARLGRLEAKRRAFQAAHVRVSDLPGFLFAVLDVVGQEAGPDTAGRCAERMLEGQAARVHDLLSGLTVAQLEDVGRRAGLPVESLRGKSAPELARLYFAGGPT